MTSYPSRAARKAAERRRKERRFLPERAALRKAKRWLGLFLAAFLAAAWIFPVLTTVCSSFMGAEELRFVYSENGARVRLAPAFPSLSGYFEALIASTEYLPMYWNSVLVAFSVTGLQAAFAVVAAFALKVCRFRGKKTLNFLYIAVMMMPFQVTLLPNYILVKQLNLYNTYWALILPGAFAPFGVFLMCQFLKGMPDELIEAGLLETGSVTRILSSIVLPSVYPGWIATMVITFADYWNLVEQPMILLKDEWLYPLSLALGSTGVASLPLLFAGAVLYMIPMLLVYRIFEDELLTGLAKAKF